MTDFCPALRRISAGAASGRPPGIKTSYDAKLAGALSEPVIIGIIGNP